MIKVFAKERHVKKIRRFLNSLNLENEIYTIDSTPSDKPFVLGISYGYDKKITKDLLLQSKLGFVNYHPAPLPEYRGRFAMCDAIKNQVMRWGVTVHYMDEEYDTGDIIKVKYFDLHEPPKSTDEMMAISHYFMFELFKETILDIYNDNASATPQEKFISKL